MEKEYCKINSLVEENLTERLSNFVIVANRNGNVEGVFLTPYGAKKEVSGFYIGVVYEGQIPEAVEDSKRYLGVCSYISGYEFDVQPISNDWFKGEKIVSSVASRLLKSGSIFYDKNGTLGEVKKKVDANDSIEYFTNLVVAPMQYTK